MASGQAGAFVRQLQVIVVLSAATVLFFLPEANSVADAPQPAARPEARTDLHGDPLPEGALMRFGTVRYRAGRPNDATLSPDGKTLATACEGDITLWDVPTGRPKLRLRDADVPSDFAPGQAFLRFSPDGKRLVSLGGWRPSWGGSPAKAGTESAVHVWDVATGEEVGRFDLPDAATEEHFPLARYLWFTPGGRELAVLLQSGGVRVLDPSTGKELRRWGVAQSLRAGCPGVAVSPDGKVLAVVRAVDERSLLLFDGVTGREMRPVIPTSTLGNVAFSPDSSTLVVESGRSGVRLFEAATGKRRKSFAAPAPKDESFHTGLLALAFSADGKVLYAGTRRGEILRWRMPDAQLLPTMSAEGAQLPFPASSGVTGVFPLPDGRSVVSVSLDTGVIRRWDTAAGKEIPPPEGFSGGVCSRLAPDGRRVAVGDFAGRLELFDTGTGRSSRVLRAAGQGVECFGWSPDGKTLAVQQVDHTVGLWDVPTGRELHVLARGGYRSLKVRSAPAFSPDGRSLLTTRGGILWVWDVATGEVRWGRVAPSDGVFSPDGKTVATGDDYVVIFLDAESGIERDSPRWPGRRRLPRLFREEESIRVVGFSPDGNRLFTVLPDGTMHIRDPKTGTQLTDLEIRTDPKCPSFSFYPDGNWLLTCGTDKTIRVHEMTTGIELLRLDVDAFPTEVEFGPGLRSVLASSIEGTATLWDLHPRTWGRAFPAAALWADLASTDGAKVYRAIWALRDDAKSAAALLREKLPPPPAADEKRVRQLVAGLDADAFADREKATKELLALGTPVLPLLRMWQSESGSAEVRRRLRDTVERLTRRDSADIRLTRAVQVLELAATAEARQLLRDWSAGAPTVSLAEDARAALARLEQADKVRHAADKP